MGYYSEKLSADRLKRCYELASPRVRQYLEAEIEYVLAHLEAADRVLELGCGYGRVLDRLCHQTDFVCGIDTSMESLRMARERMNTQSGCELFSMDAVSQGFKDAVFDKVICIQNGISAFNIDKTALIAESVRITRPGGMVLFSSYSDKFWPFRLEWFESQSQEKLLGEIDYDNTGDGVIACRDGFKATTVSGNEFKALARKLGLKADITEIDESSLFCTIAL
jgi:2-polyprenyl-6-hydroxyphenyl methylase/3-demethylubiquinone-9 3-methyltransferase